MATIIDPNNVQESVNSFNQKINNAIADNASIFNSFMNEVQNLDPTQGGFEELGALLVLPEDQFTIIAPAFLEELERTLNNVNDKLALVQSLNVAGLKVEDVQSQYAELAENIDKELNGVLSQQKRDFLKQMLGIAYNAMADSEGIAKRVIEIPVELCNKDVKLPTYAHDTDAGMDVYALEDITIAPGETKLIPTGIKMAIPVGYEIQVRPKSGRCLKTKLRVANTPGTIDSGYRDEIGVIVDNIDPPIKELTIDENNRIISIKYGSSYTIGKGEKFAQLILSEVPKAMLTPVESVKIFGEDRGGGYGSTGLK